MEKYYYNLKRVSDGKKVQGSFEPEDETTIDNEKFYRVNCVITEITEPTEQYLEPGTIVEKLQVKLTPEQLNALVEPGFKKTLKLTEVNTLLKTFGLELDNE